MTKPIYYIIFAFIWLGLGLWNIIDGKSVAGFVCLAISNIQVVGCGIIMKLNERPDDAKTSVDLAQFGAEIARKQSRRLS